MMWVLGIIVAVLLVGAWAALSRRTATPERTTPPPAPPRMEARCHNCPQWSGGPRSESAYCGVTRKIEERFEWCERHPVLVAAATARRARAAERSEA